MSTWAFVDVENVPKLEQVDVEEYERVILFCGPQSKKIPIETLPASGFHHLEVMRVPTQGKNNLDFHLAFHLGRLHRETKPHVSFHVISRDQGYDGLIQHINSMHRSCKRIEPTPPAPKLSQDSLRIVNLLEKAPETSRPGSEAKLQSWIRNKFANRKVAPKPENLIKKLKAAGLLTLQDGKVIYNLGVK